MKRFTVLCILAVLAWTPAAYADIDNLDIGGNFTFEFFYGEQFDLDSDTGDQTDFLRTEGHLWFQADLDDNIMTRISLEFDRALNQSDGTMLVNRLDTNGFGDLELFLEEAFVKWADIGGSAFTASFGRQFLNYGDDPMAHNYNQWWGPGFIIADSHPDSPLLLAELGSYEIDPFDAVTLTYETENTETSLIYARDTEDFYSTFNTANGNNDSAMTALYGSFYGFEGHQVDLYFTWQDDNGIGSLPFDGDRYILGGRVAGDINEAFAYKGEVAYQMEQNNFNGPESEALAGQVGINYHPELQFNPNFGLMYTYLQEDEGRGFTSPYDGKVYGLLFEGLYKYHLPPGVMTNMNVINLNGGWEPIENAAWTFDLYYFLLDDDFGGEDDGGIEFDTQVDYRINDNFVTFLGGGVLLPGDALEMATGGEDDNPYFFRSGVKVEF